MLLDWYPTNAYDVQETLIGFTAFVLVAAVIAAAIVIVYIKGPKP